MTPARRALWMAAGLFVALILLVPWLASTRAVNERVDGWGIASMSRVAHSSQSSGDPLPWTNEASLEALTRAASIPVQVTAQPLDRFRMDNPALTQERLSFPSAIAVAYPESNTVRAYIYRHGRLGDRPVVLWVPGQYVSDLAMIPISWFMRAIIRRGADVVLLVPPYHLERTPAGHSSGDAVFATSTADHLNVFAQELSDLRRLTVWLRGQGVRVLGGFGGSIGALMLLRSVTWDRSLDFLTVFIPAIDLGDFLKQPEAAPIRVRLIKEGRHVTDLARLYSVLDPSRAHPGIAAARISVHYGRFDRIASEAKVLDWARAWNVTRLYPYDRGHALALFTPQVYRDYAHVLDEDLRALGQ